MTLSGERGMNPIAMTTINPRKEIGQAGYRTSDLLFPCPVRKLLKPPSHSDKDKRDPTTFLKRDKRRENGVKCGKKHSFQVGSTSLLRPCHDVTASNTLLLR